MLSKLVCPRAYPTSECTLVEERLTTTTWMRKQDNPPKPVLLLVFLCFLGLVSCIEWYEQIAVCRHYRSRDERFFVDRLSFQSRTQTQPKLLVHSSFKDTWRLRMVSWCQVDRVIPAKERSASPNTLEDSCTVTTIIIIIIIITHALTLYLLN